MCVALAAAADLVRTRLIRNVATGGEGHEVLLASQPTVPTELSHGLPARRFPPPWSVATAALSSAANGSFTTRNDAESASLSGLAGWRFWPSKRWPRPSDAGAPDYGPGATRANGTLVFPWIFWHALPELKTHRRV